MEGGKVCGMFDHLYLLPTQKHQLGFDFISAEDWILFPQHKRLCILFFFLAPDLLIPDNK